MSDFPPSTHRMLADLKDFLDATRDAPAVPHHFVARYDVPPTGRYRYWDTRGRLIVYVNRATIEALPKHRYGGVIDIYESPIATPYFGIPIVTEEVGYQPGQPG